MQCPCGDMWQWPDMHLERSGRTEVVSGLVPGVRQRDGESQKWSSLLTGTFEEGSCVFWSHAMKLLLE